MNKKLLFATMSLAALTACTNDDFESKNVAQEVSPIQFEVINDNEALTRASMDGNAAKTVIKWSAADGDLFTLYHGSAVAGFKSGYENATYKATASAGSAATLTTPSMIKEGRAIMVWPVDTTFRIKAGDNLSVKIPANQTNIENNIPYVSDLINIAAYDNDGSGTHIGAYNTAGYQRKYPVFMRPMASQLIIHADYVGTDAVIATLYKGGSEGLSDAEAIAEIDVKSVELRTANTGAAGETPFNTKVPLKFANPATYVNALAEIDVPTQWATVANNAWDKVTEFDLANVAAGDQVGALTSTCTTGVESCKFLVLPQANINAATDPGTGVGNGVVDAAVVVNTRYGKVTIKKPGAGPLSKVDYTAPEYRKAWYRYLDAATAGEAYETKDPTATAEGFKTTANIAQGLMQVLDVFSDYKYKAGIAKGEQVGAAGNRWVEVNLNHLDMSDLHINTDKWLRDAARVWQKLGLESATVYLDGTKNEFKISQTTIDVINGINALQANIDNNRSFTVQPCNTAGEKCNTIVVTGGGAIRDLRFIKANGTHLANVALKAGETWNWTVDAAGNYIVIADRADIKSIINRGTMAFAADATLQISDDGYTSTYHPGAAVSTQNNIPFENRGTFKVNSGVLNVQFDVTNYGTVYIASGAQYRQDGNAQNTTFVNEAEAKPSRFDKDPVAGDDTKIGLVDNYGVFATISPAAAPGSTKGTIYNYGLIEHRTADAKTYITHNQTATGTHFAGAFSNAGTLNKMGRINLTYGNKDEDNISINSGAGEGFVSVTVTTADAPTNGVLGSTSTVPDADLGAFVNYIIIQSGVNQIAKLNPQYKYVEIDTDHEVQWSLPSASPTANYDGLMILSPVNIKLGTTITVSQSTYLGADVFVAGIFTHGGKWNGYYGDTSANVAKNYITF